MRVAEAPKPQNGVTQPVGRSSHKPISSSRLGQQSALARVADPVTDNSALYNSLLWRAASHVQPGTVSVERSVHFPDLFVTYQVKQLPAEAEQEPGHGKRLKLPHHHHHHHKQRCRDTPPDSPLSWQAATRQPGSRFKQQPAEQCSSGGGLAGDWLDPSPVPAWGPAAKQQRSCKRRPCSDTVRYCGAIGDSAAAAVGWCDQQQQQQQQAGEPPQRTWGPAGQLQQQPPAPSAAAGAEIAEQQQQQCSSGADVEMAEAVQPAEGCTPAASASPPVSSAQPTTQVAQGSMLALLAEAAGAAEPMQLDVRPSSAVEQQQQQEGNSHHKALVVAKGGLGEAAAVCSPASPVNTSSDSDLTCHMRSPGSPVSDHKAGGACEGSSGQVRPAPTADAAGMEPDAVVVCSSSLQVPEVVQRPVVEVCASSS